MMIAFYRSCALPLALMLGCANLLSQQTQVNVTSHRGDGYTVWYPANWKLIRNGTTTTLFKPGNSPVEFKISALGKTTKDSLLAQYRKDANAIVGGQVRLGSGEEPMVYGNWFGRSIRGDATIDGIALVVSATAIDANGQFYLFQMLCPSAISWEGYEWLAAVGRSLTFDRPSTPASKAGGGGGDGCGTGTQCLELYTGAMSRINQRTMQGMK